MTMKKLSALLAALLSFSSIGHAQVTQVDTLPFSTYSIVFSNTQASALTFTLPAYTGTGTLLSEDVELVLNESTSETVRSGAYSETILGSLRLAALPATGMGTTYQFTSVSNPSFQETVSGTAASSGTPVSASFNFDSGAFAISTDTTSFALYNPGAFTSQLSNKVNTFTINSATITGDLVLTYTATPEPSAWALALLCVGIFGFVRSRRARV
jgi:hypothetical protein